MSPAPPPRSVLILVGSSAERQLPTIVSRCQRQDFKRIPLAATAERLAYIKTLRVRVDRYEAYQAWVLRRNEYDECKRANRSYCSDPGPAPQ